MSERESFEAWYLNCWGHTEDNHETLFEKDSTGSDYYRFGVRLAHGAWQASREELKDEPAAGDSWIACADRMPELGKEVLVYRPDAPESGDPQIRLAIRNDRRPHGFSCYCIPTHWMPLPAPPSHHPIDTTSHQYEALSKGESNASQS